MTTYVNGEPVADPLAELVSATREAYTLLVHGNDPDGVYARLANTFAEHGLDANIAESSVDWFEGTTLIEDLTEALGRLPAPHDEAEEPCDCGDFENCASCHEWALEQVASGINPYDFPRRVEPGEIIQLPPKWY